MKHLMTLMALVVAVTAGAQGTTIYEYPWNPDSNNDNLIGVDDLLDFLPVFGDEFGNPPEPCDYDGSSLEEFVFGLFDGTIVLDSLFIEYEIEDAATYFVQGCPDPITDTIVVAGYGTLQEVEVDQNLQVHISGGSPSTNGDLLLQIQYEGINGQYTFYFFNWVLYGSELACDGFFGDYCYSHATHYQSIPFSESWYLDEEGIHIESGWDTDDWPYYANYLHILPYWHYAE